MTHSVRQVAVLSPHRDDAAFSCGILLRHLLSSNIAVSVINICTVSAYAPYRTQGAALTVEEVTRERRLEDEAFLNLLQQHSQANICSLIDLHYEDVPVRRSAPEEAALAQDDLRQDEIQDVCSLLHTLPAFDLVLAPLALGGHADHRLVREAASRVFEFDRLLLYEDLPYACMNLNASADIPAHSEDAWLPVAGEGGWKRQCALCYPSQINHAMADRMETYAAAHGFREHVFGSSTAMKRMKQACA